MQRQKNLYYELTEHNIVPYFSSLPAFFNIDLSNAEVSSIDDGNLNNVFRITCINNSYIIKQALPYLKCIGKDYPLSYDRMRYEIKYMQIASDIIPKHIPNIYHSDDAVMMVVCMQDLKKHEVMREGLFKGNKYPDFSEQITTILANMLFKQFIFFLKQSELDDLVKKFNSNGLRRLTEDYVFTFPYINHESNFLKNNQDRFDDQFTTNTTALLNIFNTKQQALIHGDLHTGSIMLNQEEIYLIDSEFAFVGPIGFDLGLLIANLITAWIRHAVKAQYQSCQDWLIETIKNVVNKFNDKFLKLWQDIEKNEKQIQSSYMLIILKEMMGFAGLEICRRICGIAGVKEIRSLQEGQKQKAEQMALVIGQYLVRHYKNFDNIDQLIMIMTQAKLEQLDINNDIAFVTENTVKFTK